VALTFSPLWHIITVRLYSAINISSWWKIQDRREIKNTDDTEAKHNPEMQTMQHTQQNKTSLVQSPFMTLGQETRLA